MEKNTNECKNCNWLFRSCTNPESPNFLTVEEQCDIPCPYYEEKSEGLKQKNG